MPTAIPELIAQELQSRLENITTGNGYSFTVTEVIRQRRDANNFTPRHRSIVVVQQIETPNPQLDHEGNPAAIGYDLRFNIHAFVRQDDSLSTPGDDQLTNEMIAAIKKAVAGTSTWHTFDSNSIDARWMETRPFVPVEGDHAGATVSLLVHYRISETDPFTARA